MSFFAFKQIRQRGPEILVNAILKNLSGPTARTRTFEIASPEREQVSVNVSSALPNIVLGLQILR